MNTCSLDHLAPPRYSMEIIKRKPGYQESDIAIAIISSIIISSIVSPSLQMTGRQIAEVDDGV